jgi:hypothetical protein
MAPLWTIELTGWRRKIRVGTCIAISVVAAIAAAGYLLPAHHLYSAQAHSNFADGGPLPLLALAIVGIMTPWLARRRFGAGVIAGVLGAAAAIFSCVLLILAHFLSDVTYDYGELVFWLGLFALFGLGCLMLVVEPVVYLLERRRIVRVAQPAPLPVARIHQ